MTDLEITRDGELMVAQVEGLTDAGVEFVDAYTSPQLVVVDSGRIILPYDALDGCLAHADTAGLSVTELSQR